MPNVYNPEGTSHWKAGECIHLAKSRYLKRIAESFRSENRRWVPRACTSKMTNFVTSCWAYPLNCQPVIFISSEELWSQIENRTHRFAREKQDNETMPKKPTKTEKDDPAKVEEGAEKRSIKPGTHTFLNVDKSMRPTGFHCDELNNGSNPAYDVKE
jgi:hypothetical protein